MEWWSYEVNDDAICFLFFENKIFSSCTPQLHNFTTPFLYPHPPPLASLLDFHIHDQDVQFP